MSLKQLLVSLFTTLATTQLQAIEPNHQSNQLQCQKIQLEWVRKNSKSLHPIDVVNATLPTGIFPNLFKILNNPAVAQTSAVGLEKYLDYSCRQAELEKSEQCLLLEKLKSNKKIEEQIIGSSFGDRESSANILNHLAGENMVEIDPISNNTMATYFANRLSISKNSTHIFNILKDPGSSPCADSAILFPILLVASQNDPGSVLSLLTIFKFIDIRSLPIATRSQLTVIYEALSQSIEQHFSEVYPLLLAMSKGMPFPVAEEFSTFDQIAKLYSSAVEGNTFEQIQSKLLQALILKNSSGQIPTAQNENQAFKAAIGILIFNDLIEATKSIGTSVDSRIKAIEPLIAGGHEMEILNKKIETEVQSLTQGLRTFIQEKELL